MGDDGGGVRSKPNHLVVMVHGLRGSSSDWQYAANEFIKKLSNKVIVHRSERNTDKLTLDGVDTTGKRLEEEVVQVITGNPEVQKISFVAHSVGGLIARYAIGKLYRCLKGKPTIYGLEAINFITVATPHLGSRGNKQVPILLGFTTIETVASRFIHWIHGRTGKHLFLADNEEGQPPLVQRMVEDYGDLYFMSALRLFKRRVAYANVGYDTVVGWRTSSIRRNNELPKWKCSLSEKYPHIVYEEHSEAAIVDNGEEDSAKNYSVDILEEKLLMGLKRVSWDRVDVSFHNCSIKRFDAHCLIQVNNSPKHIAGADVIQHIIDHFYT